MNTDAPAGVVLLTPPGRGAVATVLVEGPQATTMVDSWLVRDSGQPLDDCPIDLIVVGRWGGPGGEQVVVRRRRVDQLEIHCHGGLAAVAAVMEALIAGGCQAAHWTTWGRSNASDLLSVEAREALSRAVTLPAAAILLDQHAGAFRRGVERVLAELADADLAAATTRLQGILRYAPLGLHLVDPWRVVIAGAANVGKTTLLNALLGYRRGIVGEQPGTTRDVVTATTAFGGWPVELADTAGLRAHHEAIERSGIELAIEQLQAADAIVLVTDASQPPTRADRSLAQSWPSAMHVANKCDLPHHQRSARARHRVCALTGEGVGELATAIATHLVPEPPPRGGPVPFCRRHVAALERALAAVAQGDAATASTLLIELLGDG